MSEQETPPKWMKFAYSKEEHRVWESVFPPTDPPTTEGDFAVRRRRPSSLYMSKIVRSLAELGVYPVFRSTATGELVPWDLTHEPQQSWRLDPGIRALLGNLAEGSDPEGNIDAYYHPADLAAHFGADVNQWKYWPQGMTGVRRGPRRDDVVRTVTLGDANLEYFRKRSILKRPRASTSLISTGGVAFFAGAAVGFWDTADDRARIGRLKTKLSIDFYVLRNYAPLPADPAVADLESIEVSRSTWTTPSRPRTVIESDRQVPLLEIAAPPPAPPMTPEEELRHLEARMMEVRRLIEVNGIEEKRRRHAESVGAVKVAFAAARVTAVDLRISDFDPANPDLDPTLDVRVDGLIIALPDGREFSFGSGVPVGVPVVDEDADRAAFEADPVGYTFGG